MHARLYAPVHAPVAFTAQNRTGRAPIDWRTLWMMGPLAFVALFSQVTATALSSHTPTRATVPFAEPVRTDAPDPAFDVDPVIDRVNHAVRADRSAPGP